MWRHIRGCSWNAKPERKPYYLSENQQHLLPYGYPVFEHKKSLEVLRFFPDQTLVTEVSNFVFKRGGRAFFARNDWRAILDSEVKRVCNGKPFPGTYETDAQRRERVTHELLSSKSIIGNQLCKDVDFICWPGGANSDMVKELAQNAGYKAWTLSSGEQRGKKNCPGADPVSIRRIGTSNTVNVRGHFCGTAGEQHQLNRIFEHQGSAARSLAVKARKLFLYAKSLVRRGR